MTVADALVDVVRCGLAASAPGASATAVLDASPLAHVTLRATGRKLYSGWLSGSVADGLAASVRDAAARLPATGDDALSTVEVTVPRRWLPLAPDDLGRSRCNDVRGVLGMELRTADDVARIGPLEMVTRNLGPQRCFELLVEHIGLDDSRSEVRWFTADQYLVDVRAGRCHVLVRGQPVVPQDDVHRDGVGEMAGAMTDWLVRQVDGDGRTTYKYWPSSGTYSDADNTIRQFMASACLASASRRDPTLAEVVARNFAYNFATFYRDEGAFGIIDEFGKVKLGAAAVAVTAILNLPDPDPWRRELDRLRAFIESMQEPDGSFRTFLRPAGRNDNQNFYPGEAALALARLHADRPSDALLSRLRACFEYYRAWHRDNRNPAFVPWHTRAYCLLHDYTGDRDVADFVMEMNDWLLGIQQVADCTPDVVGEFFDPRRPHFGPPHASATGVYLEGLVEARRLALSLGEVTTADEYRRAIVLGLRSLRQMQFRDGTDMFYLRRRSRVRGGLRSSGFDNTLRLDNVQHGLMAIYEILDTFEEEDFRW